MSNNRKQIEIWDLPKKAFTVGSGSETFRGYCIKQNRTQSTALYAWIPDYQIDMIASITNPQAKGCTYIGTVDANFEIDFLTNKLEIPSIQEIDNLYKPQITAEQVNGLTNEELLSKYEPVKLAEELVKLSLQNEYYSMLINALKNKNENSLSTNAEFLDTYFNKLKDDWSNSNSSKSFVEFLDDLLEKNKFTEESVYISHCKNRTINELSNVLKKSPKTKPKSNTISVEGLTTTSYAAHINNNMDYLMNNITTNTNPKPIIKDDFNEESTDF